MTREGLPRGGRRERTCVGFLAVSLAVAWVGTTLAEESGEYAVKAAFLYNFAKYVEWPVGSFTDKFVVGIVGKDPFGKHLETIARQKRLHGVPIELQRFQTVEQVPPAVCQLVFLKSERPQVLRRLVTRLQGHPVLVVTDAEGFAKRGAAINFLLLNNKVRFEVNLEAVRRAGLTMSAKLLRLARIVS